MMRYLKIKPSPQRHHTTCLHEPFKLVLHRCRRIFFTSWRNKNKL